MRLYSGKIPVIAEQIVGTLVKDGDIETENEPEVRLDVEAVLKEYLRQERQVVDEAKNRMEIRGLPYSQLGKMKSMVARERQLPIGEDMLPYLIEQTLTMLFHSANVEEISGGHDPPEEDDRHHAPAHGSRRRARQRGPLEDQEPRRGHRELRDSSTSASWTS